MMDTNRRKFMVCSGLSVGSLLLTGCLTRRGSANDQIHLAAIGCGRMGRNDIKNLLRVADDYNTLFTAVCDVDQRRMTEAKRLIEGIYAEAGRQHSITTYNQHEDLLANRSIDAVLIATPDHSHASVAIAAANARKDIYLEKPLTYTVREGQELVRAVRRNRCVFQAGTQQRSSIYFRKVCELVRNGKIGRLERIEARVPMDSGHGIADEMPVPPNLDYRRWLDEVPYRPYTEDRVHPQADFSRPGWMQVSDHCHGNITNWGSHMFDIAQWGNGTELSGPVEVEAEAIYEDRGLFDVHRRFSALNRYANGVELHFRTLEEGEAASPGVRFIGSEGWADCERGSFSAHDREILRWEPGPGDISLPRSTNHHANFLEAVRARRDPLCPVEVAHRSNSACLINLISAKLGRALRWDPENEVFQGDVEANRLLADMREA